MYSISDADYEISVEGALRYGYKRVTKANYPLYRNECFVRHGKIWIHHLGELMNHIGITSIDDVRLNKYSLSDFFKFEAELQYREYMRDQHEWENLRFQMMEEEREYLERNHCDFDEMNEYDQEYLRSCYRDKLYKPR
ncbi:hypothetical protein [Acinetobacter vivianii]|uniref:hypothetical protein n=1 Tax=Acinetobacter vivianii TaxID=1776742 RepID=UPI0040433F49